MTTKKLTIPGPGGLREIDVHEPSIEHKQLMGGLEKIFHQLGQTTAVLNVVAGQLDLLLRVEVQALDKKVVKKRFDDRDAQATAAQDPE